MKYTEIKSFEDACKALGVSPNLPSFNETPKHAAALVAHYKLVLIVEAINEGWQPNWSDTDERKWELWPDVVEDKTKVSGFGLAYDVYVDWSTFTYVGSRLCFQNREKAKYCFETFKELYEEYFLIAK